MTKLLKSISNFLSSKEEIDPPFNSEIISQQDLEAIINSIEITHEMIENASQKTMQEYRAKYDRSAAA